MNTAKEYQVWVDGKPTKAVSRSFDEIENMASEYIGSSENIEIQTTDNDLEPIEVWRLNNDSGKFER